MTTSILRRLPLIATALILARCAIGHAEPSPKRPSEIRSWFQIQGWHLDERPEPKPDLDLIELRPRAFAKSTKAARIALTSRAFGGESLAKLRSLYHAEIPEDLRRRALGALADSPDPRVEPMLLEIYPTLQKEADKVRVLDRLDPAGAEKAGFELLVRELKGGTSARIRDAARRRLLTLRLRGARAGKIAEERLSVVPSDLLRVHPKKIFLVQEEDDDPEADEPRTKCDPEPEPTPIPEKPGPEDVDLKVERIGPDDGIRHLDERGRQKLSTEKPKVDPAELRQRLISERQFGVSNSADPKSASQSFLMVVGETKDEKKFVIPTDAQIRNPDRYRQIVIFPTGYEATKEDRAKFHRDARKMICNMARLKKEVWTSGHSDQLVYVIAWIPGKALPPVDAIGASSANFGAKVFTHPIVTKNRGLTLRNPAVIGAVEALRQTIPKLEPIAVAVIFDFEKGPMFLNAIMPSFLGKPFGIARLDSRSARESESHYAAKAGAHELAHAALNLLDEYESSATEDLDLHLVNVLTPFLVFDGTTSGLAAAWDVLIGNYDVDASEILANNGAPNVSTSVRPDNVDDTGDSVPGYQPYELTREGGCWFGHGTHHHDGNSIMNCDHSDCSRNGDIKANGDRFAENHTKPQRDVIAQVFDHEEHRPRRPNDRLYNAGPVLPQPSRTVHLLLRDADKNSRWQPTTQYQVRIGWKELDLSDCVSKACIPGNDFDGPKCVADAGSRIVGAAADFINGKKVLPECDPTNEDNWVWETVTKSFENRRSTVSLHFEPAAVPVFTADLHAAIIGALNAVGIHETDQNAPVTFATVKADQLANVLPFVKFPTPYQAVEVRLPDISDAANLAFKWKFRTRNGTYKSGFTEYSELFVAP